MGGIGGRAAAVVALAAATGMAAVAPAMATAMAVTANPADPAGAGASRGLARGPLSRLELSATLRKLPIWSVTGTLSALPDRPDGAARPPAAARQRPARTTSGEATTVALQETSGRPVKPADVSGTLDSGRVSDVSDVLTGLSLLDDVSGLLGTKARPAAPATRGGLAGDTVLPPDPRAEHSDHGRHDWDEDHWGRGEHHGHGDHWGRGDHRHHGHWGRHRHHHHRWHGRHHHHRWHHGGRH